MLLRRHPGHTVQKSSSFASAHRLKLLERPCRAVVIFINGAMCCSATGGYAVVEPVEQNYVDERA